MSESASKIPTDQPPASAETIERARVALVPATFAGMPPTAQVFWAVVEASGVLIRGFGAVAASKIAVGQYEVVFSHDVSRSAFVGNTGLTGSLGVAPSGYVTVVGRFGVPNAVFVETFNAAGNFSDRAFHLVVAS